MFVICLVLQEARKPATVWKGEAPKKTKREFDNAADALAEPPRKAAKSERDMSNVKCFRCKKMGHMIKDCTKKE